MAVLLSLFPSSSANLLEENREVLAVPERDRPPLGNLELDHEAKDGDVPVSRAGQIGHGNPEMVERESFRHAQALSPGRRAT